MRILIIRLSALGDVVTASPLPRLLKEQLPGTEVVWAVERRCADAVLGHPFVDEVLVLPSSSEWKRGRGRARWALAAEVWRQLRRQRFDVVLDCQGLYKSALISAVCHTQRRVRPADVGEKLPLPRTTVIRRQLDPRRVSSMYVSLLEPLGIAAQRPEDYRLHFPVGDPARERMAGWLAARGLQPGGYVACAPGTTRPQKHWLAERWAPLLAALGLPAVLLGGPSEQALEAEILAGASSELHSAVGTTSLKETGALLEAARLTVSVDTGPMHMAVAVGCPTIALFGSTPPRLFDDGSRYICLHKHLPCSPCHRRPTCDGRFDCMRDIGVEDVVAAARELGL